jgi:hypothetical protein
MQSALSVGVRAAGVDSRLASSGFSLSAWDFESLCRADLCLVDEWCFAATEPLCLDAAEERCLAASDAVELRHATLAAAIQHSTFLNRNPRGIILPSPLSRLGP